MGQHLQTADWMKSLTGCRDLESLRSTLRDLCAEFGKATRIEVLTMAEAERRRALCFLRLESPAQEQQLMTNLGASRFGDDVLVVVDLPRAGAACK
jgi:hypothetical protein